MNYLMTMMLAAEQELADNTTLEELMAKWSSKMGIAEEDIKGKGRPRHLCKVRHAFFYLARQQGYNLVEIGSFTGGRDHATVIHGNAKIREYLAEYRNNFPRISEVEW
jgi:chromosomal replication initiator protein